MIHRFCSALNTDILLFFQLTKIIVNEDAPEILRQFEFHV